ncbi:hypothetical protein QNN00_08085 [Bacillus velezensis]|nr:hypothetical protein [Bacillus velezensis]
MQKAFILKRLKSNRPLAYTVSLLFSRLYGTRHFNRQSAYSFIRRFWIGIGRTSSADPMNVNIMMNIRLPRVVLVALSEPRYPLRERRFRDF